MDDLIVFIAFLVIGGISWLANKIKESKEQQLKKPPTVSREDIPERTRQMLYGGEIKTAKPKQGQSFQPQHRRDMPPVPPAPPEGAPRQLPPLAHRRTVVAKRPAAAPAAAPQDMSPRELQHLREQQAKTHTHEPGHDLTPHELRALREQQAQPHTHEPGHDLTPSELRALREREDAARRRRPAPETSQQARQQKERHLAQQRQRLVQQTKQVEQRAKKQPEAQRAQAQSMSARAQQPRRHWLTDTDDVRRGIVLAEILGPPKALQ